MVARKTFFMTWCKAPSRSHHLVFLSSELLSSTEVKGSELFWGERSSASLLPLRQAATDWACLPPVPPAAAALCWGRQPHGPCHGIYIRISYNLHFHFLSYLSFSSLVLYTSTSLSLHEYIQCSFCLWFCREVPVGNRLSQVVLTHQCHILRGPREFERTKKSYSRYEAVLIKCEFVGAGCDSLVANKTNS